MGDLDDATPPSNELVFFINGKKVVERDVEPETTLLEYLRRRLRLTGTKLGCGEGGCGACTVMVSQYDRTSRKIIHHTVNACLAPICSVHGQAVTTVEGIGSTKTRLHPVQERIAKAHGSQCGFCTPGIVMSMYTLLRNNPQPHVEEMERAFEGNLCRCTGYRPILDGFKTFTKEYVCGLGTNCCRNKADQSEEEAGDGPERDTNGSVTKGSGLVHDDINTEDYRKKYNINCGEFVTKDRIFEPESLEAYDPSQEPIFPCELQISDKYDENTLIIRGKTVTWHRPVTLDQLLQLKSQYPSAKMVVGNTEVGVEVKFKNMVYPVIIAPTHVAELNQVEVGDDGITFGASVTLAMIDDTLKDAIKTMPESKTRSFSAIVEMLKWFAGHQIRNVAAVGGNIMTASPISDLNPLFMAAGATLTVASKDAGTRLINMDDKFFPGYRMTALKPDEIMLSIRIPCTSEDEYFFGYKQAHRKEDDIAIVNAGMRVLFEGSTPVIKELSVAYGGMAPITVMAVNTMQKANGRTWNEDLIPVMCQCLAEDLPLRPDAPGGSVSYRRTLTTSFFFKFYLAVQSQLIKKGISEVSIPETYLSATSDCTRLPTKGTQVYEEVLPGQSVTDSCGRPMVHKSAFKQASGEAVYVDDMPAIDGELYLGLVLTTIAHGKLLSVDTSIALTVPGVHAYIDHKDVPGKNTFGVIVADEEVFVTEKVKCIGQVIGGILATDQATAQKAAKLVKVKYDEYEPIITIEDAIAAKSFFPEQNTLKSGDTEAGFQMSDHVIEGSFRMGGQEHFYLETHACIALPKGEDGEMEIFCSAQGPTTLQASVANVLGVPASRITARVKRLGGGFGGKETRFLVTTLPAAVAANKANRSVRIMLDRDEDMAISGNRHPFLAKYKVGFTKEGKLVAFEVELYNNAGNSLDLSGEVMLKAIFHSDNVYKIPNFKCMSFLCKTNLPSNSSFRGFGAPQGMLICEAWIAHVAATLGLEPEKVREMNMYRDGDFTPNGMELHDINIDQCWRQCLDQSDFHQKKTEVAKFNSENRWKKRGIAIIPTKYGCSFRGFLNQAGALIHIYLDGSVLLAHGGVEMGQGLHTKMIQVTSRALGVPTSKIHISETTSSTVPNTSPTAASFSSDLNGMAITNACNTLLERLEPIKKENPKGTWEEWINKAYLSQISLSATGYYKLEGIGVDPVTLKGTSSHYFTYGVACSEVEIDCLTGDHRVLRTDIVMDVGTSLNPAIDIGQIEGAFTQGYGLMMLEEHRHSPKGFLYTRGPGMYKIPGFGDTPIEFNVSLLKKAKNPKAVYSSKAIGEPPLFLASSVFHAVREAVTSARADSGITGYFSLDSPASAERIRMACMDNFTEQFQGADTGTYTPWDVRA
ncbi:xanthine dehydrogenase/oxidase-like [Lineus longissimus]|uniref:xanthine dehydrogenase/oxidase-like n=1 Tax=Lineus longissimus TaxID=88925 RepID=UPI00315CA72D